jgi:hypothetical protein
MIDPGQRAAEAARMLQEGLHVDELAVHAACFTLQRKAASSIGNCGWAQVAPNAPLQQSSLHRFLLKSTNEKLCSQTCSDKLSSLAAERGQ